MMTNSLSRSQWWNLSTANLLVIGLFAALFAKSAIPITDQDVWWHLATGQHIVKTGSIPHNDIFSYTAADHGWITHEWLTEVGMIGLHYLGGQSALILATSLLVTFSFIITYRQCNGRPHLAVFAVLFAALASAVTWGPRPQLVNMLLTSLLLYLLKEMRQKKRYPWWPFPVLIALWANLHSGYFLAFVILATAIVADGLAHLSGHRTAETLGLKELRKFALTLVACVPAAMINPNGYRILWYPFETVGSQAMRQYILEWAPPALWSPEYWPTAILLFSTMLVLALSRKRRDLYDLLLFSGFSLMALLSIRHISLFAVVAAPILTRYASQIDLGRFHWDLDRPVYLRPKRQIQGIINILVLFAIFTVGASHIAGVLAESRRQEHLNFPVKAIDFIQRQGLAERRMYNAYNWGGYLIWRGHQVFIDGRADVYGDEYFDEYMLAYLVRDNWRVPLEKHSVDYVLIERLSPLAVLLRESLEWKQIYEDDLAVIFEKLQS